MKTLKESIKFTLEKKTHQISKLKNSHFIEPIEELEAYLKDIEDDSFIGENYKYIYQFGITGILLMTSYQKTF